MTDNDFIFFDPADLLDLKESYQACLLTIAQAHQSYTIAQRTFTRANLSEVRKTLGQINFAIQYQQGSTRRTVLNNMNSCS